MYWHLHGHSPSCARLHPIRYTNLGDSVAEGTVQLDFTCCAFTLPADDTLATRVLNEETATILEHSLIGGVPLTQALNVMFYVSTGTFERYRVEGHLFLEKWRKSYSNWEEILSGKRILLKIQFLSWKLLARTKIISPEKFDCFTDCEYFFSHLSTGFYLNHVFFVKFIGSYRY